MGSFRRRISGRGALYRLFENYVAKMKYARYLTMTLDLKMIPKNEIEGKEESHGNELSGEEKR